MTILAAAKLRVYDVTEKLSKAGANFVNVRGSAQKTFLSAMFFGDDVEFALTLKKDDFIYIMGELTAKAYVSQKDRNKQFISMNVFVREFKLLSAAGMKLPPESKQFLNELGQEDPFIKKIDEVYDDADVPF